MVTMTLPEVVTASTVLGGVGALMFIKRWSIIVWLLHQRYVRVGPFYHMHRVGEPYGVPMEEDHVRCLVCGREYPVSWRPRFSAVEPK